jgi:hypothetical protein
VGDAAAKKLQYTGAPKEIVASIRHSIVVKEKFALNKIYFNNNILDSCCKFA